MYAVIQVGFSHFIGVAGYLNWASVCFLFQGGEVLLDALRHLEPCLATWSGLDSTYLNVTVKARKLSDVQLDNTFFINYSVSSGVFQYNSCFSFTLS